jgi:hypothetical protein
VVGNLHALGGKKRVNHMANMRSRNGLAGTMATRLRLLGPEDCGDPMERQIWGTWQEGQMWSVPGGYEGVHT